MQSFRQYITLTVKYLSWFQTAHTTTQQQGTGNGYTRSMKVTPSWVLFFCWGGHKSCQVAAFTFLALLALAVKTLRDTKGQLLLLSSLHDTIICLCCCGFSSDHGWLTQRQAQTRQQWVWQETSSIKTVYTGAIHSQSGATSFEKKKNPLITY